MSGYNILNQAAVNIFFTTEVFSGISNEHENIDDVKIYCRPSNVFGLPMSLMSHFILDSTRVAESESELPGVVVKSPESES